MKTFDLAKKIRCHSLKMVARANASHIASALSITDIMAVLYGEVLRYQSDLPAWDDRDRFILSKGHACVAVYAALAESGFFNEAELETYGEDFSLLMNHISHKVPGVEFSTGSLGHGLPFGVGKALSAKRLGKSWKVYVLLSDGELDEGSNWEALMFASHHQLDNLVAVVDYNKLQSLDTVNNTLALEPLAKKFEAFGAKVIEINGHDHNQIHDALISNHDHQPLVLIAHTTKGKGVQFMENSVAWHYKSPNPEQLEAALKEVMGG
jgi:transketolase